MNRKVFVYGTLRPHQENYFIIRHLVEDAFPAELEGVLYDVGDYPVMIPGPGIVKGEVLQFKEEDENLAFTLMDQLEEFIEPGSPLNEYERVKVMVKLEDGSFMECETYIYPEFRREGLQRTSPVIKSGDWTNRKGDSQLV